ncbi:hypothetical protein NWP96_07825 [Mycoplasmopsis cynos]|nr:hypothetical protein [Mycoplasmopsis cynos]
MDKIKKLTITIYLIKTALKIRIYKTLEKSIDHTLEMFNNDFNLTGEI